MATAEQFTNQALGSLTGALAGDATGQIRDNDTYRRYRAGLTIGTYEHGSTTYARRSIFFEVGRRQGRLRDALAYTHGGNDPPMAIDASIPINPAQAANFEGYARKYSNFAPTWETMDLCGMVERLAKGVAAQSVFGEVNSNHLRGGQDLRVVALGTLDSPQTASTSSVFIPRVVDTTIEPHVFAVMVAAANGEGASVTTDVLRLNPLTNEPIVPAVSGPPFATACVEALRILGANFEESGAGDLFSYAVTRGVHSIVSVVAHTDEGGWFRRPLRSCCFRVPYGGINMALASYPALPPLAGQHASAASAWVDSVALKTAALVAHCDPCVAATGGFYPTVFTSNSGDVVNPGGDEGDTDDADARAIGRQIKGDSGRFAPLYIRGLNLIFGRVSISGVAAEHFQAALGHALYDTADRHLRHKTVAPYFWIEPTGLIPHNFLGSQAESAGFGAMTTVGSERAIPYFERIKELDHGRNANFSTLAFKMRTARTSGLVAAYAGAPADLAALRLYQFDEDSVVLAGDQGPNGGDVPTKHAAADPVSSYLWTRGQSPIPPPGEFINTNGSYVGKYKTVNWDDDFNATIGDLPEVWEMENHDTLWRVTVPTALMAGPSNAADSQARRARSRAAIALAQASLRVRGFGDASSPVITVSNVPYQWDVPVANGAGTTGVENHAADPGRTWQPARGNEPPTEEVTEGAPLPPVPLHDPYRAPQAPRAGQAPGGVGPQPPPAPPGPPGGGNAPPSIGGSSQPPPSNDEPAGAGPAPRQ